MAQTPQWFDLTEQIRKLPSPLHDQIVAIMNSLDNRYYALGTHREPGSNRSRLSDWVNRRLGGQIISVIGARYAEEPGGPLRRVFGVLHDPDSETGGWTNMRVEMLGIDHDYPEHREPSQWTTDCFHTWCKDLRCALIALATSGNPMLLPTYPPAVHLRAYIPPKMKWQPMKEFQDYIFRELDHHQGGSLIDPPHFQPSSDWVDYEFIIDRL